MNYAKTAVLLAGLIALFVWVGRLLAGPQGMVLGLVLGLGMSLVSYFTCDRLVLIQTGAREVTPGEVPALAGIVRRVCDRAGLPMPRLAVMPQAQPNAFATGRNPAHAVVCVTEGLLDLMDEQELEGVLAHELGHVKNRDILIMTMVAALAGAISFAAQMAYFFGGSRGRDEDRPNPLVMLLVAITAPLAAALVQAMISRTREYAADRQGALLSGNPLGLASALEKLETYGKRRPWEGEASPATAHLFIANPFGGGLSGLFATHPPIAERVARLRAMRA